MLSPLFQRCQEPLGSWWWDRAPSPWMPQSLYLRTTLGETCTPGHLPPTRSVHFSILSHFYIIQSPLILPLCSSPHFQVPNRFFLVIIQYTTHFTAGFRIPPLFVSPEFSGIGRARDDCSCKCSLYYNVTTAMLAFTFLTTLDTTMSSLFVLLLCKLEVLSTLYFQCIKG